MDEGTCKLTSEVPAQLDLDAVRFWLDMAYGDAKGLLHICSTSSWSGWTYGPDEYEAALDKIRNLDRVGTEGIYARATTLSEAPKKHSRGAESLSREFVGCWADLDIAGPGHKTTLPLPPDVDSAMHIIATSGLPEPTLWVHSGGGLYPWWMLRQPVTIDDIEDVKALTTGWQKIIEEASRKLGYSYGAGVGDLARVLRIPGTVNRKAGRERPCRIMHEHGEGRQFTFDELYDAMTSNLPEPEPLPQRDMSKLFASGESTGLKAGDDYNNRGDWWDLLQGWQRIGHEGDGWRLRRPGKDHGGLSATLMTRPCGKMMLKVFTDAAPPLIQGKLYDLFGAYVELEHHGDFRAATRDLARRGFGTSRQRQADPDAARVYASLPVPAPHDTPTVEHPAVEAQTPGDTAPVTFTVSEYTESGVALATSPHARPRARYTFEERGWRMQAQGRWKFDKTAQLAQIIDAATLATVSQAERFLQEAKASGDKDEIRAAQKTLTFALSTRSDRGRKAITSRLAEVNGMTVTADAFDQNKNLLCLNNGTLDITTMQLLAWSPDHMLTKKIDVAYDPDARADRWLKALEQWIPDPATRAYLKRFMGYILSADMNRSAFLILWGDQGCGKSVFLKVMTAIFGEYAATAAAKTFRASRYGEGGTSDLHDLRGVRLVTNSETSENTVLDEELIKRITGGDPVTTRALYQSNITWKPEFVPVFATNFPPKLRADDNAIWARVKEIHFPNTFRGTDGEEFGLEDSLIRDELAGIFNWLLEGYAEYRQQGLAEPETITKAVAEHRAEVDPIKQFVADLGGDRIELDGEASCKSGDLYRVYVAWCDENNIRPWGESRLGPALAKVGIKADKVGGVRCRTGVRLRPKRPDEFLNDYERDMFGRWGRR